MLNAECSIGSGNSSFFNYLSLVAAIVLFGRWLDRRIPDRQELGPTRSLASHYAARRAAIRRASAPLRLAGAWEVESDDPRFGGVSALAIDRGALLALTDSGAVVRFAKPGRRPVAAFIRELAGGPGSPRFKSQPRLRGACRATRRDAAGGSRSRSATSCGCYDRQLRAGAAARSSSAGALAATTRGSRRCVGRRRRAAAVARRRRRLCSKSRGRQRADRPIDNPAGRISDAVRLPDGRSARRSNRRLTPLGFANSICVRSSGRRTGFRYGRRIALGLGAARQCRGDRRRAAAGRRTRLWLMTDDNFSAPVRTLLVALDLPAAPKRDLGSGGFAAPSWRSRASACATLGSACRRWS